MSVQAITWALQQQIVADAGARHVLIGLANHADNKGRHAFPSVSLLCSYTGLKRRTVLEKLKLLQDLGVITRGNQRIGALLSTTYKWILKLMEKKIVTRMRL